MLSASHVNLKGTLGRGPVLGEKGDYWINCNRL